MLSSRTATGETVLQMPEARQETIGITAAALYEQYLTPIFRYVARRIPQREEAEDLTAEVFAAAVAALPRFRGQCSPYLWLLTIARRKVADARRRRKIRREIVASALGPDAATAGAAWESLALTEGPEVIAARAESTRVLEGLLAALSANQREALLLKYWE